jgi:hypothetical protein
MASHQHLVRDFGNQNNSLLAEAFFTSSQYHGYFKRRSKRRSDIHSKNLCARVGDRSHAAASVPQTFLLSRRDNALSKPILDYCPRIALVESPTGLHPTMEILMAFKVQVASVDLMQGSANVVAFDQPASGPAKAVNLTFPFVPSGGEGQEKERVIAAAKLVLQQALNEI